MMPEKVQSLTNNKVQMKLTHYVVTLHDRVLQTEKKLTMYRVKILRYECEAMTKPEKSLGRYALQMLADGYRAQSEYVKQSCTYDDWFV